MLVPGSPFAKRRLGNLSYFISGERASWPVKLPVMVSFKSKVVRRCCALELMMVVCRGLLTRHERSRARQQTRTSHVCLAE